MILTKKCRKRIRNILKHYNISGKEILSFAQAAYMVEKLVREGYGEEQAIAGLKHWLAGRSRETAAGIDAETRESIDEAAYYSRLAAKEAGHAGTLAMAVYVSNKAAQKGKSGRMTDALLITSMLLLLLDSLDALLYGLHHGKKKRKHRLARKR